MTNAEGDARKPGDCSAAARSGDREFLPVAARTPAGFATFAQNSDWGTALALTLISGAVFWALQQVRSERPASDELYSTDHHNVADELSGLPKDYAGIPRRCRDLDHRCRVTGRPIVAAQHSIRSPCGRCRAAAC